MAAKSATRKPAIEEQLAELSRLCEQGDQAALRPAIEAALGSSRHALVAAAASAIERDELSGFEPLLAAAYQRFSKDPLKTDKGCLAKTAIARALYRLEARAEDTYMHAVRHVQLEPVWGGKQDTAVELRVTAGLALCRVHHPAALLELARLLADREVMARIGAASAIGYHGHVDASLPLLRFKLLTGDEDARVIGACAGALLALDPEGSLAFVAELLQSGAAGVTDAVAIALGESRLPAALPILRQACETNVLEDARQALLLAIAMLRIEPGFEYLLGLVSDASFSRARDALKALSVFSDQADLTSRVAARLSERDESELTRAAKELWKGPLEV